MFATAVAPQDILYMSYRMSVAERNRKIHYLTGKAYNAIHDLVVAIPPTGTDPVTTQALFDSCRNDLLIALRACQILYATVAPPPRTYAPCPCGCDTPNPRLTGVPDGGAGTHSE